MPKKTESKDAKEILNDRERFLNKNPELAGTFTRFLQDWKHYTRNQEFSKKRRNVRSSTFGVIFKKREF